MAGERNWHACSVPYLPPADVRQKWRCDICWQVWIWRRPPRPVAQWVRREAE